VNGLLRVREFDSVPVGGRDGLREPELDYLQRLRDRSVPFFDERRRDGRWWCRFGGYVGAIILPGGRTLELLPKLEGAGPGEERALVMRMLAATGLSPALEAELGRYAASPHLLEAYLAVAADLGRSALRQGLVHAYERRRFESPAVRGRLRLATQLARYPSRYDRLLVEADVFTPDTPVNRAIKAGIGRIARLTHTPGTLALCRELLTRLDGVGDLAPSAVGPAFDSLYLDRRSARLRSLVEVLALIVRDRGSAAAAAPEAPGPAWLFAMDQLWERFVGQRLRRLLPGLEVTEQGPARSLTTSGIFLMRPDLVVAATGRVRMVLDTKWKVLTGPSDVDVADLRQAYAYARVYDASQAALLYPTWADRPAVLSYVVADVDQQVHITVLTLPLAEGHAAEFDNALLRLGCRSLLLEPRLPVSGLNRGRAKEDVVRNPRVAKTTRWPSAQCWRCVKAVNSN
jgi:5-methylcytosine-specific restriction enzyme subunit McrC